MSVEQLQQISEAIDVFFVKARRRERSLANFRRLLQANKRKLLLAVSEWMKLMIDQLQKGLNQVKGKKPRLTAERLADWKYVREQGEMILKPVLLQVLGVGGNAIVGRKIVKQERFDPIGVEAVGWATEHSAELVTEVATETKKAIRTFIADGVNAGKSIQNIASELRPVVGLTDRYGGAVGKFATELYTKPKYSALSNAQRGSKIERYANKLHRVRTEMIARTETRNALWEGTFQGYGQMGIKRVEGVSGPGACDWCIDNIDGKVYTLGEARSVAADSHPSCACAWVMSGKIEPPSSYAQNLSNHAIKYEPRITRSMKGIASDTGATLNKLEFRRKTVGSIERKIAAIAKENPFMSLEQIAKGIEDTVRYTAIAPTENFASIVNQIDLQLSKQGYRLKKVTNYYGKKGPYQGINAKYFDPKSKLTFEVQFHTKQSVAIVEKNHLIYEKARISTSPAVMDKMNAEMISNWDDFVMPEGAPKLFGGGK